MAVLGFTGRGNNKTYNASYDEIYSSVREFLEKDDYQFIEDNFYKDYPNLINDERVTVAVKSIQRSKKVEKLNNDFSDEDCPEPEYEDPEELESQLPEFDFPEDLEPQYPEEPESQFPDEDSNYVNDKICESWSEYLAPFGYFIDHTGVFKEIAVLNKNTKVFDNIRKDVCKTPFILSGVSESPDDNSIFYKVRYASINGTVKELWANQYDLLSKRELKKLFNSNGINCPENSILNETISYISQSIAEFGSKLKKEISTKQNGWQDNRFIWGNRAITKDRVEPILALQKFP
jgi:hypothetical protein